MFHILSSKNIRKIHHDLSGVSGKITSKVLWKMTMIFVLGGGGFILHFSNFLPNKTLWGHLFTNYFILLTEHLFL